MPLVWAHSEYVKLARSLHDNQVFDMPPQTVQRYQIEQVETSFAIWRFQHRAATIPAGKILGIEVMAPALVLWSADDWHTKRQIMTQDTGLEVFIADLPTSRLASGKRVCFTFCWTETDRWEGEDFTVTIAKRDPKAESQKE